MVGVIARQVCPKKLDPQRVAIGPPERQAVVAVGPEIHDRLDIDGHFGRVGIDEGLERRTRHFGAEKCCRLGVGIDDQIAAGVKHDRRQRIGAKGIGDLGIKQHAPL